MSFERLTRENIDVMVEQPEIGMDIQIGRRSDGYTLVVGGRLSVRIDEGVAPQLARLNEIMNRARPGSERYLQEWTATLSESSFIQPIDKDTALSILGFIHLGPLFPLAPPPPVPASIYGHLPFHGLCSGNEVFYRYEHYPTSIRLDLATGEIKKRDTYAAPSLELDYVKSGLGAVARYALLHFFQLAGGTNCVRQVERRCTMELPCRSMGSRAAALKSCFQRNSKIQSCLSRRPTSCRFSEISKKKPWPSRSRHRCIAACQNGGLRCADLLVGPS